MNRVWERHGECLETELKAQISEQDYEYYVAYQTNRFVSGTKESNALHQLDWSKLLEIRLFSEREELLARRSMIGKQNRFQWRIASEEGLSENEYYARYQKLDIDSTKTDKGEGGNLKLMTTGGGSYELPITEDKTDIEVISYVSYDEDGMAFVYDDRLSRFISGGKKTDE